MAFVVAIDGPAGTGKGTITKIIAEKMNLINCEPMEESADFQKSGKAVVMHLEQGTVRLLFRQG